MNLPTPSDSAARLLVVAAASLLLVAACRPQSTAGTVRVSGYVEATDVQVAAQVGGRVLAIHVNEGDRVAIGQPIADIDTTDVQLALRRARADRDQADAQLRLLLAGTRPEDIRQARAQLAAAQAEATGARDDLAAAETDVKRFETLLRSNSGSEKQRDDAVARRDTARARAQAADERVRAADETLARLQAGARPQEIQAARARVSATDAQIATFQQNLSDAALASPVAGIVTQKLIDAGETIGPRTPVVTITDLDRPWANVYVDEPFVPKLRLGAPANLYTDAGGPAIPGTVTFISPKAEFTPRNVQTATERSKLVYRVKVTVENRNGVLKQGMPVEAEFRVQ